MLQARVKQEFRFGNSLQAFARVEFTKLEWRDVPAEFEAQARTHADLEVRERPIVEAGAIETVAPATVTPVTEPAEAKESVPTAEQLLDQMLAEMPGTDEPVVEEVKETRRGRGGKRS